MNLVLFDGPERPHLLPFTFTRPVSEIRVGILTIREKWEKRLETKASFRTEPYLADKFKLKLDGDNLFVNGAICPDLGLIGRIVELKRGQGLYQGQDLLACRITGEDAVEFPTLELERITYERPVNRIEHTWDIFLQNGEQLERDFGLLTDGRTSQPLSRTNTIIGERIFVEEGVSVEASILNATERPIYIGKDATILEGCMVRGGLALGEHSALKMGAKIYGPTTLGPHCKVGGEVNNAVLFGYSNKGHDGFLGNAVLGEWVNIGADTNNSNLKNNYDEVRLWSYVRGGFERTGQQFCGLMMGDHSKCGINTMFNTGTVIGVSANVFGSGFPRNFVPSFSWGGHHGFQVYQLNKALETAERMMARRDIPLSGEDRSIMEHVFNETARYRNF